MTIRPTPALLPPVRLSSKTTQYSHNREIEFHFMRSPTAPFTTQTMIMDASSSRKEGSTCSSTPP